MREFVSLLKKRAAKTTCKDFGKESIFWDREAIKWLRVKAEQVEIVDTDKNLGEALVSRACLDGLC